MKEFEFLQVVTTVETREDADRIARLLVEEGLAACVQVLGPIESTYRWKGRIERAGEMLCLIKTSQRLYPDLERAIRAAHRYETPEIVALAIVRGSSDYLSWLRESLGRREPT